MRKHGFAVLDHNSRMVVSPQNHSGIPTVLQVSRGGAATHIVHAVQQCAASLGFRSGSCLWTTSGLLLITFVALSRLQEGSKWVSWCWCSCLSMCSGALGCMLACCFVLSCFEG